MIRIWITRIAKLSSSMQMVVVVRDKCGNISIHIGEVNKRRFCREFAKKASENTANGGSIVN